VAAVLALLSSVGFGAGDFIGGYKARTIALINVLVVSQVAGLLIAIVALAAIRPPAPTGHLVIYALAAGLFQAVGLGAYYRGLASGAMGVVAPISATAAIIPVTVGLTLGETFSLVQAVGIAVAILGVVLTSAEPGALSADRPKIAVGVGLALVAATCLGFGLAWIGRAAEGGHIAWVLAVSRVSLVAMILLAVLRMRIRPSVPARELLPLASIGAFSAGATLLFAQATTYGQIGLVAVITSVYPITTVGLAWLVMGERIARVQRVGAGVALVGVALVAS